MTHPYSLAYPVNYINGNGDFSTEGGLTKREYFAAMAMKAILSTVDSNRVIDKSLADCISADAIVSADALIEALNKQEVAL